MPKTKRRRIPLGEYKGTKINHPMIKSEVTPEMTSLFKTLKELRAWPKDGRTPK